LKSFETWKTWALILGLLLFSAAATVAWPWIQEQIDLGSEGVYATPAIEGLEVESGEMVTIQLEDYLLGEVLVQAPLISELDGLVVHPLVLTAILAAISFGALFAVALPLAFIYVRLDRQTVTLKEDEGFQAKQAALEKRQQQEIKELEKTQPPRPMPDHERSGWSIVSTSAIIIMFVVFLGFALADTFFPAGEIQLNGDALINPALPVVGVLLIITLFGLIVYFRPRRAVGLDEDSRDAPIPWGTVWVVVSGLVFLGIGIGLMLAVRAMGSG
jgi:hypothetical protein